MKFRCRECRNGIIEHSKTCSNCNGLGYFGITLGVGEGKKDKCKECNGKGKLVSTEACPSCKDGFVNICDFCGVDVGQKENGDSFGY